MSYPSPPMEPDSLSGEEIQAHRAAVERMIQSELHALLGTTPSREASFFDLGMNSLQLTQLGSRLAARSGVHLPAAETMRHPSIARLTDLWATTQGEPALCAVPAPASPSRLESFR
ncbi:MAG: acyl carrier protein, partial [Magnetococcales bacterium]|nr:acyl carrier protein [Magnetococcales bacterium]